MYIYIYDKEGKKIYELDVFWYLFLKSQIKFMKHAIMTKGREKYYIT